MKKLNIIFLCSLFSLLIGQNSDQNWVKSIQYLDENGNAANALTNIQYYDGLGRPKQIIEHKKSNGNDLVTHIGYDNSGRQIKEFLPFVRNTSSLNIEDDAENKTINYYNSNYNSTIAFFESDIENSPLNRMLRFASPGDEWGIGSGHEIEFEYKTNSSNEVRMFSANTTFSSANNVYNISLNTHNYGYYAPGRLYKIVTKDENHSTGKNNTIEEYTNKQGQIVLKRTYESGIPHDTYFVYDIYGNLTYVLPPSVNVNTTISSTILNNLCYQYKYDDRNRIVEKKLPGKGWEYIVYDLQDRLVAIQDQNMRSADPAKNPFRLNSNVWLFTKYDRFGRVIYTGYSQINQNRTQYQNSVNAMGSNNESRISNAISYGGATLNYTNSNAYPISINQILTFNYYDDYNFNQAIDSPANVEGQNVLSNSPNSLGITTKNLPTSSFIGVLSPDGSLLGWEKNFTYYDQKSRNIRSHKINHLGGFTKLDKNLDFRGKTIYQKTFHKKATGSREVSILENFEYDNYERLRKHSHKIGRENTQLIALNEFNGLGQLTTKKVGGYDITGYVSLQTINYDYNIRGWLTNINDVNNLGDDLFAYKINYSTPSDNLFSSDVTGLYNGNISETIWRTSTDNSLRGYGYSYDNLNRLKRGYFQKNNQYKGSFDESLTYDKNGNIKTIKRWGVPDWEIAPTSPNIDDLNYSYYGNSNRLRNVNDTTGSILGFNNGTQTNNEYIYDYNGNITSDLNKSITNIKYNHLNLPTEIMFQNGNKITYVYNAIGMKIEKHVYQGTNSVNTEYFDGFQYVDNYLQFFPHAEGYVNVLTKREIINGDGGGVFNHYYDYVFNQVDHQGNIRMSYTDANRDGVIGSFTEQYCAEPNLLGGCNRYEYRNVNEVLEENHYYPYGLKHFNYNTLLSKYQKDPLSDKRRPVNALALDYKYKYVGKEWQDELNLNVYALDYRQYDPALGRFSSPDVLAEKAYSISPYRYGFNNPVFWRDPLGLYEDDWGYDDWGESERDQFEPGRGIQLADIIVMGWNRFERFDDDYNEFIDSIRDGYDYISENSRALVAIETGLGIAATRFEKWSKNKFHYGTDVPNPKTTVTHRVGAYKWWHLGSKTSAKLAKVTGVAGKVVAGAGAVITVVDVLEDKISFAQGSLDVAMTAVGVFGGPVGAAVSIAYFGGKAIYELSTGETIDIGR